MGFAGVAQSVEQLIRNEKVEGSIPFTGTNRFKHLGHFFRGGLFAFQNPQALCNRISSACTRSHQPTPSSDLPEPEDGMVGLPIGGTYEHRSVKPLVLTGWGFKKWR